MSYIHKSFLCLFKREKRIVLPEYLNLLVELPFDSLLLSIHVSAMQRIPLMTEGLQDTFSYQFLITNVEISHN